MFLYSTRFLLVVMTLGVANGCSDGQSDTSEASQSQTGSDGESPSSDSDSFQPDCPVDTVCVLCDDGSCASPSVAIVDGVCGETTWTCSDGTKPDFPSVPASDDVPPDSVAPDCPVDTVCVLCDDGSCASPSVTIVDGVCGEITWVCAE